MQYKQMSTWWRHRTNLFQDKNTTSSSKLHCLLLRTGYSKNTCKHTFTVAARITGRKLVIIKVNKSSKTVFYRTQYFVHHCYCTSVRLGLITEAALCRMQYRSTEAQHVTASHDVFYSDHTVESKPL